MTDLTYEGEYIVRAPDIHFVTATSTVRPEPSSICIAAVGGGNLLRNGSLELNASGQVVVQAGSAIVALNAKAAGSDVSILNGTPGTILLNQGQFPGAPAIKLEDVPPAITLMVGEASIGSAIKLEPTGMSLSYGVPNVGSKIEMGPTGLTLQFGLWSIALGPTGIDLTVGPNTIRLQAQGISLNGVEINLAALTTLKLEALQIQETAALQRKTEALLTSIG